MNDSLILFSCFSFTVYTCWPDVTLLWLTGIQNRATAVINNTSYLVLFLLGHATMFAVKKNAMVLDVKALSVFKQISASLTFKQSALSCEWLWRWGVGVQWDEISPSCLNLHWELYYSSLQSCPFVKYIYTYFLLCLQLTVTCLCEKYVCLWEG